jgi:ATP phosphoribosyltransferase
VATKYPTITRDYFQARGINPDIITLHGSIELAPLVGLADGIVDLTSTGTTMRENRLQERFQLYDFTTRMIVNRVAHKMLAPQVGELVARLREIILDQGGEGDSEAPGAAR